MQPSMSRATSTTGRANHSSPKASGDEGARSPGRRKLFSGGLLIQLCARVGQLLPDPAERRAALGDLALQPRALGEHGVELVVERLGVAREVLGGQLRERAPELHRVAD